MSVGGSLDQQWARVSGRLKDEVGETAYRSWLKPLTIGELKGGEISITVPTRFMRDWVLTHYADRIRALWSGENPRVQSVDIVVAPTRLEVGSSANDDIGNSRSNPIPSDEVEEERPVAGTQLGLDGRDEHFAHLDPRFTFENFVVGKPNEFADGGGRARRRRSPTATVQPAVPLWRRRARQDPPDACDRASAVEAADPNRRVVYLSAEKFMYQFVRALRSKDTMAFKELFRSVDLLMVDDVQFISGKDSTQEEFFHTFNALVDREPADRDLRRPAARPICEGIEERMRSRLGWGLVADIHPTTYELRLGILQAKAEQLSVQIPPRCSSSWRTRSPSNVRELEGALNRIVAHAELVGRADHARDGAGGAARPAARQRPPGHDRRDPEGGGRALQHPAGRHDLRPPRPRGRPAAPGGDVPRQAADHPLAAGDRQASSAAATTPRSCTRSSKIEELRTSDPSFAEDVELLRRMLAGLSAR